MIKDLNQILVEWSYRTSDGKPDVKNRAKLLILENVLNDFGWSREARAELLNTLMEAPKQKGDKIDPETKVKYKIKDKDGKDVDRETTYKSAISREKDSPAYIAAKALQGDGGEKDDGEKLDTGPEFDRNVDSNKGISKDFERSVGDDGEDEKSKKQNRTKKQIQIAEDLRQDLDFILENRDAVRLKSGGGSNSPSVQDVKDLKEFTVKRMEQDKRRLEAGEKGEEFNEEAYVHPNIIQREVNDETLDKSIDYLRENLEEKDFENLINRFAKGGAVPRHLTKLTKLKKGEDGYPGLDKESVGYKRAREIIRLYIKNDAKSPVTGKPLPLSHMEPDHRVPFSTAESDIVESDKFKGLSEKAKKPADGNSIQEIMKKKKNQLTDYDKKVIAVLEPLQAKYDNPTSNMDLMAGPVNQFKGSLINNKLLNSIRKKLAENPEEKKLVDEYTSERKRLITKYHRDSVENGGVPPYHEYLIRNADKVETNAMMKAHNYYHPDSKTITMYLKGDKAKGIKPNPDYYEKVKDFWAKKGVELPDSVDDVDVKKPPFNQTMAIYVGSGSARGRANRRKTSDDHNYMVDEFSKQEYFGSTLQEDKEQEQVIDDSRKKVNKILDMKQIEILKVQLQNPNISDRARNNRQEKLDKLQSLYGEN